MKLRLLLAAILHAAIRRITLIREMMLKIRLERQKEPGSSMTFLSPDYTMTLTHPIPGFAMM